MQGFSNLSNSVSVDKWSNTIGRSDSIPKCTKGKKHIQIHEQIINIHTSIILRTLKELNEQSTFTHQQYYQRNKYWHALTNLACIRPKLLATQRRLIHNTESTSVTTKLYDNLVHVQKY